MELENSGQQALRAAHCECKCVLGVVRYFFTRVAMRMTQVSFAFGLFWLSATRESEPYLRWGAFLFWPKYQTYF